MRVWKVTLCLLLQLTVVAGTGEEPIPLKKSTTDAPTGSNSTTDAPTGSNATGKPTGGNESNTTSEAEKPASNTTDKPTGGNESNTTSEAKTTTTETTTTTGGPSEGCPPDHLICSNGTIVYRQGGDCKFPECYTDDFNCHKKCLDSSGAPIPGCAECEEGKVCCKEPGTAAEASLNNASCAKVQMGYISKTMYKCVPLAEEDGHEEAEASPIKNPGVNCLEACGSSGFCPDFCGVGNACCHLGDLSKMECAAVLYGDYDDTKVGGLQPFYQCLTPKFDTADFWQVSSSSSCKGTEKEFEQCLLAPCPGCVPTNCTFSEWTAWVENGDSTGLKYRSRRVTNFNNECGECDGPLKETAKLDLPPTPAPLACSFNHWTAWSTCNEHKQVTRTRTYIDVPPQVHRAIGCVGNISETQPCEVVGPKDCVLGDWLDWTDCSRTCEGGRQQRFRPTLHPAEDGGKTCEDVTIEQQMCALVPCKTPSNCTFGDWLEWEVLEVEGKDSTTKVRSRETAVPVYWWTGMGCSGVEKEMNGSSDEAKPCPVEDWTEWGQCSSTCGEGQRFRTRGSCLSKGLPEMETIPCGLENPCNVSKADCVLSDWSAWTKCDRTCGSGQTQRTRTVAKPREEGGRGCLDSLTELASCKVADCEKTDCVWNAWAEWSACSRTCGSGTRTRDRNVTAPRYGGAPCPVEAASEIETCGTERCAEPCEDATWSPWSEWGACSTTCGPRSYRCHHRHVALEANWCGKPVIGETDECEVCSLPECAADKDCELSEWTEWSECSCSCYGTRMKSRTVASMATGNGKGCSGTVSELEECNPIRTEWDNPPADCHPGVPDLPECILSDWSQWGACSATCAGGIQIKNRVVKNEPCIAAAATTNISLEVVEGCNNKPCEPEVITDCSFTAWSDWTACNSCDAHTFRSRSLLSDASPSGDFCIGQGMREVATCAGNCKYYGCKWTLPAPTSTCTATCGNGTKTMTRTLKAIELPGRLPSTVPAGFVSVAEDASACYGEEVTVEACIRPACAASCTPLDCTFSPWSAWALYGSCGYVERHRHRHPGNECGQPCVGLLSETKVDLEAKCSPTAPINCVLGDWSLWTRCKDETDQKTRARGVEVDAKNGGLACEGALKETMGCGAKAPEDSDCKVTEWSEWGICKEVCENPAKDGHDDTGCPTGVQERSRTILSYSVGLGGACTDILDQVKTCPLNGTDCVPKPEQHCVLPPAFSPPGQCIEGFAFHTRETALVAGKGNCTCDGNLKETEDCDVVPTDCQMSEWRNTTCQSNGHMYMHRQVHAEPTHGGKECAADLVLVADCSPKVEKVDCLLADWSEWSVCPATCGKGQSIRARAVTRQAAYNGLPCSGVLEETKSCELKKCGTDVDCEWYDWQDWHACTCTCGGGVKERSRPVKAFPEGEGAICEAHAMKEAAPCNTQSCETCINGTFGDWSAWGECSASCIGGVQSRHRGVSRPPNSCGLPPEGLLVDYKPCNVGISCAESDCRFGDWGSWSACSNRCTGTQTRTRIIAEQGYGKGAYCAGSLEEAQPCNPGPNETIPDGCPVPSKDVACALPDWGAWGVCTTTCGVGQHYRQRTLPTEPADGFSSACIGDLYETGDCANAACPSTEDAPVDCQWTPWGDWSACTMAGGQRHRHRDIAMVNKNGGRPCVEPGETLDAMQTDGKTCYTRDLSTDFSYCGWGLWSDWSPCDATCGIGIRSRERSLGYTSAKPLDIRLSEINEELQSKLMQSQSMQTSHLAAAFVGGAMTLVLLSGIFRFIGTMKSGSNFVPASSGYRPVSLCSPVDDAVGQRTEVERLFEREP